MDKIYIYIICAVVAAGLLYMFFKNRKTDPSETVSDGSRSSDGRGDGHPERHVHFKEPSKTVSGGSAELVLFFSETCPPCQAMKPNWNSARPIVENSGIRVTEFSAQSNMNDIVRYGISGFPTIYLFPNGKGDMDNKIIYTGDRSTESIVKFAQSGGKMD